MTDTATDTPTAPAPAAPETPAPAAEQRPTLTGANDTPPFTVPDAWKDKPWAAKIKTEDDIYKQIDTLDQLKGKKQIVPDFDNAKPEEIEEYFSKTRPADKSAYQFGEDADPGFVGAIGEMFLKNGVSAYQGNALIKEYQALEKAQIENATSADGFKEEMTKSFGEKYDAHVSAVVKEHKAHLSPEDQAVMDAMPNQYLGAVYRLTEAMRKAYGANETGAAVEGGGTVPVQDVEGQRKDIRDKLAQMDNRPHTAEEKQKLIDELTSTYKGK